MPHVHCLQNHSGSAWATREHAALTLAAIEKGYTTLVRFFSQAEGLTAEEESELWSKFQQLGERLVQVVRKR